MTTARFDLRPGVYEHYKGHYYQALAYAYDSNEDGRVVVVYIGLELTDAREGPRMHVRTAEDFFAIVDKKTGEVVDHPYPSPDYPRRFTFRGNDWRKPNGH